MIHKAISSYFQCLQDKLNGYQILFDTLYTPLLDDYKQAMTNYNLRQMYDFDVLKSLKITEQDLEKLSGKSYNVLQYKYNPPVKSENTMPNHHIYEILYTITNPKSQNSKATKQEAIGGKVISKPQEINTTTQTENNLTDINTPRTTKEIDNETESILQQEFIEFQEALKITDPQRVMQRTIHQTTAFQIIPTLTNDEMKTLNIKRYGFYADIPLECRFITSSSNTFEQFIILYNILFHKLNPPAYMTAKEWGDRKYPILTKYEPISSAQQVDTQQKGNLLEISFNVTISTMIMSNFFKKPSYVNNIDVYFEARNNSKGN